MITDIRDWQRLVFNETGIYIYPEGPDWVLPNKAGDIFLCELLEEKRPLPMGARGFPAPRERQFFEELQISGESRSYEGRSRHLSLRGLSECWFHITNRCNLRCSHCMFSCSPHEKGEMALDTFSSLFNQAFDLGSRTFFFTGGEPLIHPEIHRMIQTVLDRSQDTRLVILTNGILLESFKPFLAGLPQDRLYLQISLDGIGPVHDKIRGRGSFEKTVKGIEKLSDISIHTTIAMAVTQDNVHCMADMVDFAADSHIPNIHYLWMFASGNAADESHMNMETLFSYLKDASEKAEQKHITIDNVEALEKQVFSPQGTKYDLGIAGWESLAVGPDGSIYPTPALMHHPEAFCGNAQRDGLETVWRDSILLKQLRKCSIAGDASLKDDPLKYIVGGGDLDHSFYNGKEFTGHDPYIDLYRKIVLWRISEALQTPASSITWPCAVLRMGDRLLTCDDAHGEVALTHSNCVLSLSNLKTGVETFYGNAALDPNLDIANPVCYPEEEISHVPQAARIRSYGCGSPVLDADVSSGQTLVDIGSGAGMECFIAARKVGRSGRVYGIDMTDHMLEIAGKSLVQVEERLQFKNVEFKKSALEDIPLEESSADIVISNCVINLSGDKHWTFREIFRILKPGGRLMISDIVTDSVPSPAILNDPQLRGECIAGALTTPRLMALLEIAGFKNARIIKRFFYREVQGHHFYSITYEAFKPLNFNSSEPGKDIFYPGPFAAVMTDSGDILLRGQRDKAVWQEMENDPFFLLDEQGSASNISMENTCACYTPPETAEKEPPPFAARGTVEKTMADCMKCGSPLTYFSENRRMTCALCGVEKQANAMCENGHFICDACHSSDAYTVVKALCLNSDETDMIRLFNMMHKHPAVPLHGPEHHFIVPAAITAAYRNLGGRISEGQILSALERGRSIPGGSCGFWGGCGAALGVGIAFAIILESNPITPGPRQNVQQLVGKIINELGAIEASRCCQRESWTAMIIASEVSGDLLPISMPVDKNLSCGQAGLNKECPGRACPYFKKPELFQTL